MVTCLICHPRCGMCNQFIFIERFVNAAKVSDGLLWVKHYCYNYRIWKHGVPFHTVCDIPATNEKLKHLGVTILKDKPVDKDYTFVTDPVGCIRTATPFPALIVFSKDLREIVEEIRTEWGSGAYTAVHLRAEDDMVRHLYRKAPRGMPLNVYARYYQRNFLRMMRAKIKPPAKLFLATWLGKSNSGHQMCSGIIQELEKDYTILNSNSMVAKLQKRLNCAGREIMAIVDMLLCCQGEKFYGLGASTFSKFIFARRGHRNCHWLFPKMVVNLPDAAEYREELRLKRQEEESKKTKSNEPKEIK